jgi:integrating conjugative element protein (TIGR03761 family)
MITNNTALADDDSDYSEDDLAIFSGELDVVISDDELGTAPTNQSVFNKSVAPVQNRPGRMSGDVTITLHTLQAHQMFLGRKKNEAEKIQPITGLLRFAGQMNKIWVAASHNDPYADYILFDIEQSLNNAADYISEKSEEMSQQLNQLKERGYKIELRSSSKPIDLSLRFAPEFTHKAALILLDFDYLMRQSLSLRHAASLDKRDFGFIKHSGLKLIRAAFESSLRYQHTNVTRDDIAANNPVAQKAKKLYKFDVPQQILEGIIRAEVSPHLATPRK